jgi:hypothetical protein
MLLNYQIGLGGLTGALRGLRRFEQRVKAINRAGAGGILGGSGMGGRAAAGTAGARAAAGQRTLNARMAMEEQRHQNRLRQIRERGNQARLRDARRAARAEARIRQREEARAARTSGAALRGGFAGRTGQSIRSGLRAVGTVGAGLLTIGGGFALAGAIGQEKNLRAATAALANQARSTEGGQGKSFQQLQQEAMGIARTEGIRGGQGPEAIVGMMRQFQAITGRFDIATQYSQYMSEIADATDAELGDVGRTAGQIFQAINATGKDAQTSIEATMKIMDAMAGQSKIGSIEMNDLAQQMGKLMSATANFKGDIGELAADMGAMAQTAIAGGAASAPEAMTSLMRFADDLVQRGAASPVYRRLGIDVFEREMVGGKEVRAKLKSPVEVIKEIVGATKGDIAQIQSMFGIRAKKAVDPFARIYREAEQQKAGTGIEAIEKRFQQFRAVSLTEPQRKEAAGLRRAQADRQLARVRQEFNDAIGQQLLPVIIALIPKFTEMIPALTDAAAAVGRFVSYFAEHPVEGIGLAISAAIVKDIGAAGIGNVISTALGGSIRGASPAIGNVVGLALAAAIAAGVQAYELSKELKTHKKDLTDERRNLYEVAVRQGKQFAIRERSEWEGGGKEYIYRDPQGVIKTATETQWNIAQYPERYRQTPESLKKPIQFYSEFDVGGGAWDPTKSIGQNIAGGARIGEMAGMQRGGGALAPGGALTPEGWIKGAGPLPLEPLAAAGKSQQDAAKMNMQAAKLNLQAAEKIQAAGLNRSDAPSPTAPR